MAIVPTITVKHKTKGIVNINADDFDPKIHSHVTKPTAAEPAASQDTSRESELAGMSRDQLVQLAGDYGLSKSGTKAALLKALLAYEAGEE